MSGFQVVTGDCRVSLTLEADSVDAVVTDPPYELGFMGKSWDKAGVAFDPATWAAVYRVLKPGGRMLAFGGSRTQHRIWCAIEDAGFVIEDSIMWLYGSGFPKHKSKLKPAFEPICVARKGPVSELNIDATRIPTDDVRDRGPRGIGGACYAQDAWTKNPENHVAFKASLGGRWPANVVLDEEAAALLDEQSGELAIGAWPSRRAGLGYGSNSKGTNDGSRREASVGGASRFYYCAKADRAERDAGLEGAPKRSGGSNAKGFTDDVANGHDRNRPVANHHPTVKPVDLMRWLVRLVTEPGQLVLDPFTGSGSTGVACVLEGRAFIGIELQPDYAEMARKRIAAAPLSLFA